MPKRTIPRWLASGAVIVAELLFGDLVSKPIALILLIPTAIVLFAVAAGTETVQRALPDAGRLPFVRDHRLYELVRRDVAPANDLRGAAIDLRGDLDMLRRRIADAVTAGRYWRDLHASDVWERSRETLKAGAPYDVFAAVEACYLWFHELNQSVTLDTAIPSDRVPGLEAGIGHADTTIVALRGLISELEGRGGPCGA